MGKQTGWRDRLALFPVTTRVSSTRARNALMIGGCDLERLAAEHGTPLYLYDRATLDQAAATYRQALATHYPAESGITYAGKAFLCLAIARWAAAGGMWIDCTGASELAIAAAARVPRSQVLVHGVNKGQSDLTAAAGRAGTVVVDSLDELTWWAHLLADSAGGSPGSSSDPADRVQLWLRLRPGVTVQTHAHAQTGQGESKFGMDAAEVLTAARICRARGLPLTGLHFHLGSRFADPTPLEPALEATLDLMAAIGQAGGWAAAVPPTLCPGGGWAVAYHEDELPQPDVTRYVRLIADRVVEGCRQRGMRLPRLQLEPGRSLIARAGVALYRVGAVKMARERRWLLLDGGLADNPRPALYGARYTALPVRDPARTAAGEAWLGGPYCESGDVLIERLPFPEVTPGELVAVPVSGAYHLSMASNYNGACRPAVLWLDAGQAQLIQVRETPADLISRDRPILL